jgi:hypothetical protein
MIALSSAAHAGPLVTVGANFAGSNQNTGGFGGLGSIPDTNGAVGPGQFVELINGFYRVYDKSGVVLQQSSDSQFWSSAGVTPIFPFDPRVLYDPASQRWFASSADNEASPSSLLLAVSKTSDPTQGWRAVVIPSAPNQFFDAPQLGINRDAVYVSATLAPSFNTEQIVIPKSDLLQAMPTSANATVFANANVPHADPPAVAYKSSGSEPFMSADGTASGVLKITSINGPPTTPSLDTSDRLISVAPEAPATSATQKGTAKRIGPLRVEFELGSDPVLQDGKLFAVQGIEQNGRAALRWFEIGDPLTAPLVLDSGIINPSVRWSSDSRDPGRTTFPVHTQ